MNTMCVCISLSAYVTLFCLFSPKLSIILLHPDKNVRKLTMNSATYKRPFKPVSSFASADGRNNLAGPSGQTGQYTNQADCGSGGPMSITSNVLNLGESGSRAEQGCACNCFGFTCRRERPERGVSRESCWRHLSLACCWLSLRRYINQCCSLGEVGPTTLPFEMESQTSASN